MPDLNQNADLVARQIRTRSTKLGSEEPEDTVTATGAEMLRVAEVIEAQAAEISRLRDALKRIVDCYDACSGAEPSLSLFHRTIDVDARTALGANHG